MTTAIDHARAVVSAMTSGRIGVLCKQRRNDLDFPRAIVIGPDVLNAVALVPFTTNREAGAEADAAGFVLATAALRVLAAEETVEVLARVIDPEIWSAHPNVKAIINKRGRVTGYRLLDPPILSDDHPIAESLAKARAILDLVLDLARKEAL